MNFKSQHVIITGGSSGIGRATAHLLAQHGAHISIIARRQNPLDETLEELEIYRQNPEQRFRAYSADLSDWTQAQAAIVTLTADDLPADILLNSAGITQPGYFQELPLDTFHEIMAVNYFGTLHPIRLVVPTMIERRSGYIINTSSVAGFLGVFGYTAYCASKFAIRGFSDTLRQELKPYNIHVSTVFPPDTDTPMFREETPLKPPETQHITGTAQVLSAEQVARSIVRGIERRKPYIFPNFESWLYFTLTNSLTGFARWYLDYLIARSR